MTPTICQFCRARPVAHEHHITPRSKPPDNEEVIWLCIECHELAHAVGTAQFKLLLNTKILYGT